MVSPKHMLAMGTSAAALASSMAMAGGPSPIHITGTLVTHNAVACGTSALMTSTMVGQKTLEDMMVKEGLKDKCKTNVDGAPVTQQWADRIGADIYSESANDAVAKFTAEFSDA